MHFLHPEQIKIPKGTRKGKFNNQFQFLGAHAGGTRLQVFIEKIIK